MQDYKLLWTDEHLGIQVPHRWLFGESREKHNMNDIRSFFSEYLNERIDSNITRLKKLITNRG